MHKISGNAIQRARICAGMTQEALAEASGYSSDAVRAWENGGRRPSLEALDILAETLGAKWLPSVYLKEETGSLDHLIPDFKVGRPLAEAAADYITATLTQSDAQLGRKLLRMVSDGKIDDLEANDFDALMKMGREIVRAFFELIFSNGVPGGV